MNKTFTFSKLNKLGDLDPKYGQAYWGEPNEQVTPVKFNSMNENITAEDTIEAEEILLKTSGKGIDYHQLKKVKVVARPSHEVEAVTTGEGTAAERTQYIQKSGPSQLDRIEAKLDELIKMGQIQDPADLPIFEVDND